MLKVKAYHRALVKLGFGADAYPEVIAYAAAEIETDAARFFIKLLEEKDMYGYEMIDTLRGKSKNVFELKAGTLYPLLHGLEEKGFVESYEKEAVGKIRKYYHITRSGKKELKKKSNVIILLFKKHGQKKI